MQKLWISLITLTSLLVFTGALSNADIYITPEPDIIQIKNKLRDDIQQAQSADASILQKLELSQESLHALNRLKVYKFIVSYAHFQKEIDQLYAIIISVRAEMEQIMDADNPSTEELRNLFEYTYNIWYLIDAQMLLGNEHLGEIKAIHAKRYDFQSKIAGLTKADAINGDVKRAELGLQSRIWLAIYHLQSDLWNKETQDVYLQPLLEFLNYLNEQQIESPKIEQEILHARNVEIQIYFVTEQYQLCIDSVDKYFGETIKTLTPETPESEATRAALGALSHKIKCIGAQHRPDIFSLRNSIRLIQQNRNKKFNLNTYLDDVRNEAEQYPLTPDQETILQETMKTAEYLTTFGDRHSDISPRQDPLIQHWRLVFKFYEALGMKKLGDEKKIELADKYPKRFAEYRMLAEIEKQRQQMQEQQENQRKSLAIEKRNKRWMKISQYAIGSLMILLTMVISARKRREEEEKEKKNDGRWKGV